MNDLEPLISFLWDCDPASIDLERNASFLIERILEFGDEKAVQWLFDHYSLTEIVSTLKISRRISEKSRNFWDLVLEDRTHV
ncbi:MAG: hypothetical protein KKC69_04525 [Acidobacteria bacterium]|nr:hypothetical protein [Acidobacteriota bacterium]MBU2438401.1 hypothetical protein [Acidobacteriota bacterium]